ncbi:MAG: hypothetical protein H0U74_08900, partial [Bradymonadaceae bacterium]|nr:hypothetical protein [Lujinxingiaceae bacterium]
DVDVDHDVDHGGKDIETFGRRFNPLLSFKFYTFALAFFGLTGVIFTLLALASPVVTAVLAAIMGFAAGLGVSYVLHVANRSEGSAGITEGDYKGTMAKVMLPIKQGQRGKVRMQIKGRTVELLAVGEDDEVMLDLNEDCIVLGIEDGVARVVDSGVLERREKA